MWSDIETRKHTQVSYGSVTYLLIKYSYPMQRIDK